VVYTWNSASEYSAAFAPVANSFFPIVTISWTFWWPHYML